MSGSLFRFATLHFKGFQKHYTITLILFLLKMGRIYLQRRVSVICGGTDFEHMEDTGYGKLEWFKERLELPNGIPDSDTFRRVFERLNPKELAEILQETVAIDGKTICGSGNGAHRAYHVVSAWVAENQITLGQLAVAEKSNEITAIPELLDMLDVSGSTVTVDAMGCQKQIASTITENHADYVLGLKGNQSSLLDDVKLYFEKESAPLTAQTKEKDHGRIEQWTYYLETQIDWLSQRPDWAGLNGIGMVKTNVLTMKTGEMSEECRYFLTSLTDIDAFAHAVRKHWSIESQLNWLRCYISRGRLARQKRQLPTEFKHPAQRSAAPVESSRFRQACQRSQKNVLRRYG